MKLKAINDLKDYRDITKFVNTSFSNYLYSVNFVSLEDILGKMYMDFDITIPQYSRNKKYSFLITFTDLETNEVLTVDVVINLTSVDRLILSSTELLF